MSRCAPSGALKRALRVLRPRPARLRHAQAHGKASIETLTPIRCGGSSFGDKIGPSYSCGGQRDWGHAQASLREMVLFAPPWSPRHQIAGLVAKLDLLPEQIFADMHF